MVGEDGDAAGPPGVVVTDFGASGDEGGDWELGFEGGEEGLTVGEGLFAGISAHHDGSDAAAGVVGAENEAVAGGVGAAGFDADDTISAEELVGAFESASDRDVDSGGIDDAGEDGVLEEMMADDGEVGGGGGGRRVEAAGVGTDGSMGEAPGLQQLSSVSAVGVLRTEGPDSKRVGHVVARADEYGG